MKEQIAEIIKHHAVSQLSLMKHEETGKVMEDINDLSEKIDKAIGIDEDRVKDIIKNELNEHTAIIYPEHIFKYVAQAIAKARPLKCEVE